MGFKTRGIYDNLPECSSFHNNTNAPNSKPCTSRHLLSLDKPHSSPSDACGPSLETSAHSPPCCWKSQIVRVDKAFLPPPCASRCALDEQQRLLRGPHPMLGSRTRCLRQ